MPATIFPSSIRLLLTAAAIHMLGACPCGCLEGNGWYQTAVSILGEPDCGGSHEEPCDCDHPSQDVMMASERGVGFGKVVIPLASLLPLHDVSSSSTNVSLASAGYLLNLSTRPSLKMLQVMRL